MNATSSSTSTSGWPTSSAAMLARLRWPPESEATGTFAWCCRPSSWSAASTRPPLPLADARRHPQRRGVAQHPGEPELAVEHVVLGHERDLVPAAGPGEVAAVEAKGPRVEGEAAGERTGQRGLAGTGRPDDSDEPTALHGEAHVVEQHPSAGSVRGDPDHLQQRLGIGEERAATVAAPRPGGPRDGLFRAPEEHRSIRPYSPWAERPFPGADVRGTHPRLAGAGAPNVIPRRCHTPAAGSARPPPDRRDPTIEVRHVHVHARPSDSVVHRIQALLAKAESTEFPDEAEAFLAKAQELMARHAIDDAMLRRAGAPGVREVSSRGPSSSPPPYASPRTHLLGAVARATTAGS